MDNKITIVSNDDKNTLNETRNGKIKFLKLLTTKNLKILILVIIAIVGIFVYFGMSSSNTDKQLSVSNTNSSYLTTLEYCQEIEMKLKSLLSNVKGAGNVSVMVTVDGSPELVYAKDTDEKVSSNPSGSTTTSNSSSPIIVTVNGNSNALILTENLPTVKGVIVVSSGANDVSVKLDILNAVSTLLDISVDKISVLKGV